MNFQLDNQLNALAPPAEWCALYYSRRVSKVCVAYWAAAGQALGWDRVMPYLERSDVRTNFATYEEAQALLDARIERTGPHYVGQTLIAEVSTVTPELVQQLNTRWRREA